MAESDQLMLCLLMIYTEYSGEIVYSIETMRIVVQKMHLLEEEQKRVV